jgi:hypothetical protein
MPQQFVVDITHYMDTSGEFAEALPRPALKLASYFALLVENATQKEIGESSQEFFPCRKKRCSGTVATSIADLNGPVYWFCSGCSDQGIISNWQATKWDSLHLQNQKG